MGPRNTSPPGYQIQLIKRHTWVISTKTGTAEKQKNKKKLVHQVCVKLPLQVTLVLWSMASKEPEDNTCPPRSLDRIKISLLMCV